MGERALGCTLVLAACLGGCGDDGGGTTTGDAGLEPDASALDAGAPHDGGRPLPDAGARAPLPFSVLGLDPGQGPFSGGGEVLVRGAGFDARRWGDGCVAPCGTVSFGETVVEGAEIVFVDAHRLRVIAPPGAPGAVEVTVVQADESATSTYTYQALAVEPASGSMAGGTRLSIYGSGTAFASGDSVSLGGEACLDPVVVSPTLITCTSPPGELGLADVEVRSSDGAALTARDGFLYYDPRRRNGGLDGGPIAGALDISVADARSGLPIPDAFVIVGEDVATPLSGRTDAAGMLTLSADDLAGPLNVHVAKACYETMSFIGFDASRVTAMLVPHVDCFPPSGPPPGGGRSGAFVSGELVWAGPSVGPNPWANVPEPRSGEARVAYVYTTQAWRDVPNPEPGVPGETMHAVVESLTGDRGYRYRIFTRPGGLAIYALAGLETTDGTFTPYVMGLARGVLVSPGAEVEDVDVAMDVPLDRSVTVSLAGLPTVAGAAPDAYRLERFLSLPEGVIPGWPEPFLLSRTDPTFTLVGEPALGGPLADARYVFEATWESGLFGGSPLSARTVTGLAPGSPAVTIDGFLDIPEPTAPAMGGTLPADRVLRWDADAPDPTFTVILINDSGGRGVWRQFVRGDLRASPIPDLSSIRDVDDIAPGTLTWALFAMTVPGLDFDRISYADLGTRRATHLAQHYYTAVR